MIVDKNIKVKVNNKSSDQEKLKQILSYKEKYSPEELKSIISFFKDPINQLIARKLLLE
ncbi:unnamed protein product [marine sediment metagenome]|uniref:Uncharacterized protein n=1 Tax=marine sediment metagenome TaxID=412755 RepID=X1NLG8_9ZZZZ